MYQHQREVENSISITMQSYMHVGWRHNGPGVTGRRLRRSDERRQMVTVKVQNVQGLAYRTRYRTRARDKVTAAEQRAASTLLNLLEEP
eukprot:COSAG02_NODE_62113_length_266_cov_4.185629_1_plen_88_part_11